MKRASIFRDPDQQDERFPNKRFCGYGLPSHQGVVESDLTPSNYSLVNTDYVGKALFDDSMDLDVDHPTEAHTRFGIQCDVNKEYLLDKCQQRTRDVEPELAACNFIKVTGHVYHLYKRPSGQTYFSMLSPEDWGYNPPHKFLGCWVSKADQNWVLHEDMTSIFLYYEAYH